MATLGKFLEVTNISEARGVIRAVDIDLSSWTARNPGVPTVPRGRTAYFDKADTSFADLPATLDTGQSLHYSQGGGTSQLIISGGGLTLRRDAPGDPTQIAGYVDLDAGSGELVTRIGLQWHLRPDEDTTVLGGNICLAMTNAPWLLENGTAYRMGMHFYISYYDDVGKWRWVFEKVSNATGTLVFTEIDSGDLDILLTYNVSYRVDAWRIGDTVFIHLPDGQRIQVTDADISNWSGQYGFYEPLMADKVANPQVVITEAWYDWGTAIPPQVSGLINRDLMESGIKSAAWRVLKAATATTSTTLGSANIPGMAETFIAPESGSVVIRLGVGFHIPTAAAVYLSMSCTDGLGSGGNQSQLVNTSSSVIDYLYVSALFEFDGLTPGNVHTVTPAAISGGTDTTIDINPGSHKRCVLVVEPAL